MANRLRAHDNAAMSPATHPSPPQTPDLGPAPGPEVELRPPPLTVYAGSLAMVAAGGLTAALAIAIAVAHGRAATGTVVGVAALGTALLAAGTALLWRRSRQRGTLRLHERGLALRRRGRAQAVAFATVDRLTVDERERLANGVPVGRSQRVVLAGRDGSLAFSHLAAVAGPDPVCELVAERMLAELRERGSVAWGPHARLTTVGVEVTGRLGLAGGRRRQVPYSGGIQTRGDGAVLDLVAPAERKRFLRLRAAGRNFRPGLAVLELMVAEAERRPEY